MSEPTERSAYALLGDVWDKFDECLRRMHELEDELKNALKREAAILQFCRAEMEWEYFRSETKIGENPSLSWQNANKLRAFLDAHKTKDKEPMEENNNTQVPDEVAQTKQFRKDLDEVLQRLKLASDTERTRTIKCVVRGSRERSIAIEKLQEAIMWLGMDLKAMNNEGMEGCPNPYPSSYDPGSPVIEPTADGLKM